MFCDNLSVLCAIATTCKALRQAVQESSYCGVEVVLRPSAPLSCLRSFVQWLPKHFRLVQSVRYIAEEPAVDEVDGLPWQQHLEEGGLLLQEALQSAAAAAAAADAANAAAAAAAGTEVSSSSQACAWPTSAAAGGARQSCWLHCQLTA